MKQFVVIFASLVAGFVALPISSQGHQSGCHSSHSCPSDHHTYVWYGSGGAWDCARPGADEYDPSRDATTIVYGGYTYYCRAAASPPPPAPPPTECGDGIDNDGDGLVDLADPDCNHDPSDTSEASPPAPPVAPPPGPPVAPPPPPPLPPPTITTPPRRTASACHAGNKADRRCTPGMTFAGVRARDVCIPGWAARHRHVTMSQRRRIFARYGVPYSQHSRYELDHLVALELGGSNADRNLWPEPGFPNAKDKVENRLHRQVCAGSVTLRVAQRKLASDWTRRY